MSDARRPRPVSLDTTPAGLLADLLEAQVTEWELWRDNPTQASDDAAERFYRATGLMAPYKSQPLEMSSADNEALRQQRYEEWSQAQKREKYEMLRQCASTLRALATSSPPAPQVKAEPWDIQRMCQGCITATHCATHKRCLAECVPADVTPAVPDHAGLVAENARLKAVLRQIGREMCEVGVRAQNGRLSDADVRELFASLRPGAGDPTP